MTIESISSYLQWIGAGTIGRLWLPLLLWTAAALPIYGFLRWRRTCSPHVRYRVLQALLFALPVGLMIGGMVDIITPFQEAASVRLDIESGATAVLSLPEVTSTANSPSPSGWNIYHGLGLMTVFAAALGGRRLIRLGIDTGKLHLLGRRLSGQFDRRVHRAFTRIRRQMRLRRHVQTVVTSRATVPMTFGFLRPTIVIPASMAAQRDQLRMTLTHEIMHVRRWDYLCGLIERLISGLFVIHPLTGRLRQQISSCREMACDMEVLELLSCSTRAYATLLLETSRSGAEPGPLGVAMRDSPGDLKRRILAMKAHAGKCLSSVRAAGLACGTAILLGVALMSGCADRGTETYLNVKVGAWKLIVRKGELSQSSPPISPEHVAIAPDGGSSSSEQTLEAKSESQNRDDGPEVFVAVEEMPRLKDGLSELAEKMNYPEEARQAGVEGRVIVQFIVDEQGNVLEPRVLRGIGAGCDREAVEVVRQAAFEPGRQRGRPVHVKMSLPVRFELTERTRESGEHLQS